MSARAIACEADIDIAAEFARLEVLGGGGVASFMGVVRPEDRLAALRLETYPAMVDRALAEIVAEAMARWDLLGATLIHRHGMLAVGARIVFVGTVSRHRAAALEACAFLIDWTKVGAPFWKQEIFADGTTSWIEARSEDGRVAAAWDPSAEHGRP